MPRARPRLAPLALLLPLIACTGPASDDADDLDVVRILSISPADGATDVPTETVIRVVFDAEVDPDALALALDPPTAVGVDWDAPSRTASFRPAPALPGATEVTATLDPAVGLTEARVWSFTTVDLADAVRDEERFGEETATAEVTAGTATGPRTYLLRSSQPLRDNLPEGGSQAVTELSGQPTLRSGDLLSDALFALAVQESRDASVDAIRNGAFNGGNDVPCRCFETGEKWTYVWTRDTAYAAALGLAWLDPTRTAASLRFKLSEPSGGGPLRIVQDTGTGGSWPVSTDRVVWALGARATLALLPADERVTFAAEALEAMATTLAEDRAAVFDAEVGLYRGEQSFLDWREQSYPSWTAGDPTPIAASYSLSTNVGHLALMETAAALGDATSHPRVATWEGWAADLRAAIADRFAPDDGPPVGLLLSPGPTPAARRDLLGEALANLEGVFPDDVRLAAIASYPRSPHGPPVMWPQQPLTPIYHNRGIWPFVTAYSALAAAGPQAPHGAALAHDLESLVRGAALNLSHMENLEWSQGVPLLEAGAETGPVVNSRRQLWSVAGFAGAWIQGVFGLRPEGDVVHVLSAVPDSFWRGRLRSARTLTLRDLTWRGHRITVTLKFPEDAASAPAGGTWQATGWQLSGGGPVHGTPLTEADAQGGVTIEVPLARVADPAEHAGIRVVADVSDFRTWVAPREPTITDTVREGAGVRVTWSAPDATDVTYTLRRDGAVIADGLTTTSALDPLDATRDGGCWTVTATWAATGLTSHPSRPVCWTDGGALERVIDAWGMVGAPLADEHGRMHLAGLGDRPDDVLVAAPLRAPWTGRTRLWLTYGNGVGDVTTGIASGSRWLVVAADGVELTRTLVAMPHRGSWDRWGASTTVDVDLVAGALLDVWLEEGPNMTTLAHFGPYSGPGGGGRRNVVNVAELRLLSLDRIATAPTTAPNPFDGVADGGELPAGSMAAPGAPLAAWSQAGAALTDDHLLLTLVSPAFEQAFRAWVVYVQAFDGAPGGPATPAPGLSYSNQTATLPFTPTHAITLRRQSDAGDAVGPFNGVWEPDGSGSWRLVGRFATGRDAFFAADQHTGAVAVPRAWLGDPGGVRLAAHVVQDVAGNEYKDLLPATHTPWTADGGAWLDLVTP